MLLKKQIQLYLGILLSCCACVQDDDFDIPSALTQQNTIPEVKFTTFKALKGLYQQAINTGNTLATIQDDVYIEAYVVSTDKAGNFFEELIIQNKTDAVNPDNDPRLGLKLAVNQSNLHNTFAFGQQVIVKLKGLAIGETSGVLTLGKGDGVNIDQIQASEYRNIILRTNTIASITPKLTTVEALTEADENTLIQLDNMQIHRLERGATFASEAFDTFDGFRVLESCNSGTQIAMQTSTFSSFKTLIVPQGNGAIVGVFSRDFRDDFSVVIPNTADAIRLDGDTRCDPLEHSCGIATQLGEHSLLHEDFEAQKNNKPLFIEGWTNYIQDGTEAWEAWSSTATNASLGRSARFQSASSGDVSNIGWLITPLLNLDAQDGETLRFKTSSSRADSSFMEVLYASDWDGTEAGVTKATWQILSDAYIVKNSDAFVPWFTSGNVDLSCIKGTIHIAFKYTGGGLDTFDGVYELDDIQVDYVE